jgi:hypothetical protein
MSNGWPWYGLKNSALIGVIWVGVRKVLKKMKRSGIKETPFQTVDDAGCF